MCRCDVVVIDADGERVVAVAQGTITKLAERGSERPRTENQSPAGSAVE